LKIVGFIPYWLDYSTTTHKVNKNQRKLAGRHLINYSLTLLNRISFIDEIVIFASNPKVLEYVDNDLDYSFLQRPDYLDQDDITIEEIISEFLNESDADVIVLLHPNSPFLQLETVATCIEKVKSGKYDSAFTAYKYHKFAWYQGKPLNYSLNEATPKLEEIEPVILEQASLYVFTRKLFLDKSRRIGDNYFIKEINHFEGHDVNEPDDFEIAELIINSGMYKEL
jgi:CMP-N-acetylneuraminic acid synthetase